MPPSEGRWKVSIKWDRAIREGEVDEIPCESREAAEAIWHWKNAEESGRWQVSCEWAVEHRGTAYLRYEWKGGKWTEVRG